MQYTGQEPGDDALLEDIRAGGLPREAAWRFITFRWGGQAMGTVMKRTGCNEVQAREAFSSACMGVDSRVRNATSGADFLQKASLKTYLTQAAIFAAWAILKKMPKTEELSAIERSVGAEIPAHVHPDDCTETMDAALEKIGGRCQKILTLFNDDHTMEEIAREINFKNADVAKREKYKCQERFKAFLRENPALKKQLIENCYG